MTCGAQKAELRLRPGVAKRPNCRECFSDSANGHGNLDRLIISDTAVGRGFLPSEHQGVQSRAGQESVPVLIARVVRFNQLFHPGWEQHGDFAGGISRQCKEPDQASVALIPDLKRRGLFGDAMDFAGENAG